MGKPQYPRVIAWWVWRQVNRSGSFVRSLNDLVAVEARLMVPLKSGKNMNIAWMSLQNAKWNAYVTMSFGATLIVSGTAISPSE
jgi:hypothetical protein